ncbi:arylsulfatase [Stieleria sp. TO1_6]|uniref:arylsulfatase B n=1 Tax=Stieleria tagensis TaxID=2956795 RepID=UPI00209A9B29|nr:arylsulfatase [Stieleria tagensis]MCO8121497.1 arylsulfatase [Stieleria tagensis]
MRYELIAVLFVVLMVVSVDRVAAADQPPNIVLMLSDDMGWSDPGFQGGDKELTPNMDRLADQGLRLTQFYAHSVCAPTRSALMTGRYAFRNWMDWRSEDFGKPSYLAKLGLELPHTPGGEPTRMLHGLDTSEYTIAEALRAAGYFTALVGKWHLGEWLPEQLPMGQGFDHQYGHYGWGIDYNNYTIPHNAPARYAVFDWHRNQQPLDEQGYSTDLFANEAVRLISQQSSEQPFFLYVPFNAIHGPLEQIPRYTDSLDKRSAALKCLDDAVGRIVGAIDQYGFAQDTLLVLANDNGGLTEAVNAPYRGTKNTTFEGGVRVACVMRWPGKLPAAQTSDAMMHVVDFLPTFVAIAGGDTSPCRPLDGMDMTAVLTQGAPSPRREIVYEVSGSVRLPTIRDGDYKLMGDALYDIRNDPSETTDVADKHPDVVAKLKARLDQVGKQRPPLSKVLGSPPRLMDIPLPAVYGREENRQVPEWLARRIEAVRSTQPKSWPPGETPWPQAPTGATIEYSGDGR